MQQKLPKLFDRPGRRPDDPAVCVLGLRAQYEVRYALNLGSPGSAAAVRHPASPANVVPVPVKPERPNVVVPSIEAEKILRCDLGELD